MSDLTSDQRVAHRTDGNGHWLTFGERDLGTGPVTGCGCGFRADIEADAGWGDSVIDHIEEVIRAEERSPAGVQRPGSETR